MVKVTRVATSNEIPFPYRDPSPRPIPERIDKGEKTPRQEYEEYLQKLGQIVQEQNCVLQQPLYTDVFVRQGGETQDDRTNTTNTTYDTTTTINTSVFQKETG